MLRRLTRNAGRLAAGALLLASAAAPLRADDGYDLWLRYVPVSDAARMARWRSL